MSGNSRLYLRYLGVSVRGQMQYRASFCLTSVAYVLTTGVEFMALVFLFQRFGSLRGWSLSQAALLYGIVAIAFALAEGVGRGFDTFTNLIKTGNFDRLLLRPRSTLLQVAGQELQLMRIGRLAQGACVLGWSASRLGLLASPLKLLLVLETILGAACMFYALFVLQAVACFWTIEQLEIWNAITYGGTETGQYPLTIYRDWFRNFFTYVVPLACFNYIPATYILGRSDPSFPVTPLVAWLAPWAGVGCLLVSFQVWHIGVRHYRSTGS